MFCLSHFGVDFIDHAEGFNSAADIYSASDINLALM